MALLVWMFCDYAKYGKPSVLGAVNGMIAGLVAITPSAGVCNGYGAAACWTLRRHHSLVYHECPEPQAQRI